MNKHKYPVFAFAQQRHRNNPAPSPVWLLQEGPQGLPWTFLEMIPTSAINSQGGIRTPWFCGHLKSLEEIKVYYRYMNYKEGNANGSLLYYVAQ